MKLASFIIRDLRTLLSYRFALILTLVRVLVAILLFYFIGRTFGGTLSPLLARYGGDYFPYVLMGIVVSTFVAVGLSALSAQIRGAQLEGTLEALLGTPTSIYTILIGNSLFQFIMAAVTALGILFVGAILLRLPLSLSHAAAGLFVLFLTFAAFLCVGMLSASFVMIFKQGDPIGFVFGTTSYFLGGVLFPVTVLPRPLQVIAQVLPTTHAVEALRELFLARVAVSTILPLVLNLAVFIALVAPLSVLFFRYAVRRARISGSLVQY